jgi:hypothetical protein
MFQSPFHPDNNAIWRLFKNSMYSFFLSRPLPESTDPVEFEEMAATTAADPVEFEEMAAKQNCCAKMQRLLGDTSLKLAFRQTGAQCLAGDTSIGAFRPIVPQKFRKDIFTHNVAHPGRLASHRIISSGLVWRRLSSNITTWTWPASGARSTATHALPPEPSPSHSDVFLTSMLIWWAHCSIVTVLIIFFTIIDCTPKWMEAVPLSDTSGAACAKALTFSWMSRFGVPEMITSDCGPQFTSNLWF